MRTAAVVGAGLSGLTAAYRLKRAGWTVQVFESEAEVGGRVRTVARDGYLLDTGASVLATSYTAYNALAEEVGLLPNIVAASPYLGVYRGERVHLLRLDRMIRSSLTTRLLSPHAKLRAARIGWDVARARSRGYLEFSDMRKAAPLDTEDARSYALRVASAEVDSYLCEPIVRTMQLADTDKVSRVELLSGLANTMSSRIYALRGGQGVLPRLLAHDLDVALETPVHRVSDLGGSVEVEYSGQAGDSVMRGFDAAVIATPLHAAARICPDRGDVLGPLTAAVGHSATITVAVGTTRAPDCPAVLVVMPSPEDSQIALLFLEHNKCADRAPAGHGLIEVHWEIDAAARHLDAPDAAIASRTLQTVLRVFPELAGSVEFTHVTRWPVALPHSTVGAFRHIDAFHAGLRSDDRIHFASDYLSSAGQNTAVAYGDIAARNILSTLP